MSSLNDELADLIVDLRIDLDTVFSRAAEKLAKKLQQQLEEQKERDDQRAKILADSKCEHDLDALCYDKIVMGTPDGESWYNVVENNRAISWRKMVENQNYQIRDLENKLRNAARDNTILHEDYCYKCVEVKNLKLQITTLENQIMGAKK